MVTDYKAVNVFVDEDGGVEYVVAINRDGEEVFREVLNSGTPKNKRIASWKSTEIIVIDDFHNAKYTYSTASTGGSSWSGSVMSLN
ncbi:MAG: hypothetical protein Ta2D_13400 [Rickettsiales bacterium]|nr:MAG: hypothetical protein Ta2D_13400 [Rickettsiales bacterium]